MNMNKVILICSNKIKFWNKLMGKCRNIKVQIRFKKIVNPGFHLYNDEYFEILINSIFQFLKNNKIKIMILNIIIILI